LQVLCDPCLLAKVRVNWKYAITTFVVLRYAITIYEIGYMPLQFNQMPKLSGKFQYRSQLQWQVSIPLLIAMASFHVALNCNGKFPIR
jgi:hypothetical protein